MWRSPIVAPCPSQGVAPAFCMLCRYGLEPDTTSSSLYGGSARPAGRRARRKAGTMRKSGTILAIALAGILSACASGPAPVDVTRFHLGRADAPLERGTIVVEPFAPAGPASLEYKTYAAAVQTELMRNGYTVPPPGGEDRKSTRLNSSPYCATRMP